MYQVPATRSSVVQFVMTCPGMSHSSTFTLHMRDSGEVDDGKVWGDLCRVKRVNIAYNNEPKEFEVDDEDGDGKGEMVRKPYFMKKDIKNIIPWDWEILDSFFRNHDIEPTWLNCHYDWGKWLPEEGRWSGAIGKVGYEVTRLAVISPVSCVPRSRVTRRTWPCSGSGARWGG